MIFFILFIFALVLSILEGQTHILDGKLKNKNRHVFAGAKVLELCMFLLCALRSLDVGIDTLHYYESFNSGISRFVEPGYWMIRSIALYGGNSFQLFLALYALVSLVPLYKMLKYESINISFSLLIYLSFSNYFYPEVFNTIRATAAIGFFVLALSYFDDRHYIKAILFFFISSLFHISALVAIAIVLFVYLIKKLPQKICYISIIASVLFGLLFQTGFSEYSDSISFWLAGVTGDFADYYSQHLINLEETDFNIVGTIANMLPFTIFSLLLYDENNSKSVFYKLFVVGTILSNIFISITLVYRITMFCTILLIVILPNTLIRIKGVQRHLVRLFIIFMLFWYIYKLFGTSSDNMAGIIPYSFFFEL